MRDCIRQASSPPDGFSDGQIAALQRLCESAPTRRSQLAVALTRASALSRESATFF
jgi:hypothetical protein